jgi:hypothetical protein
MTTSHTMFRRRVRRGALALIVSAILVPASSALAQGDTPADYPGVSGSPQTSPLVGDTPADFPGVSGSPQTSPLVGDTPADFPGTPGNPQTPPSLASHAPEASGFDWTSAGIGAAGAGLLIVVALGGATAASRLRFRTMRS